MVVKNPLSISITVFDASVFTLTTIVWCLDGQHNIQNAQRIKLERESTNQQNNNTNSNSKVYLFVFQLTIVSNRTTKEKREQIVKQMNTQSELYKNKVKNVRKYYMDVIKQMEKQSASKDQIKRYQNDIQKVVDSTNNEINSLLKQKSNEILNGSK